MQPLVQSAIDAANRGENNKALEFCKQALAANPNDVDAWLVVAAVVDQPERKRQCLNRVLSLDPTNQIARDELLDMDRAAMGGAPPAAPQPAPPQVQPTYPPAPASSSYPTNTAAFESEPASESAYPPSPSSDYPTSTSAFESTAPQPSAPIMPPAPAKAAAGPSPRARVEKPLVFKSPIIWQILMYIFALAFGCFGSLMVFGSEFVSGLFFVAMAFLMGIGAVALSKKVEVSEMGIRASGMLGSSEVKWNEIKSMKSSSMKQRLELYKSNGQVVQVSNQVSGYPRIVEILRQKRPDLFGMAASGYEQASSSSYGGSVPAPAFSGAKTFRKSFIRQYGLDFVLIFFCLMTVWLGLQDPELRVGSFLAAGFCLLFMIATLFQVSTIKVEPNRLIVETLFEQKEFSARQVKEIKMQSVRGRYGRVTHYVLLVTEGKKYSLGGFSEGEDVLYGFLTNWWDTYKNR